jgi:hypothetical protein
LSDNHTISSKNFFASVERVMIDRGAALVFPSRPDLNWSPTTEDRVWNVLGKFDQQITANHTWSVRYLRELSPQRNQAIGQVTPAAVREEDDKDQTLVATMSSVFGSTKLNALRVGWTQEDVAFANACFNGNGQSQIDCPPTLGLLTLNALVASDGVIIPVQTQYYALKGFSALMNVITQIRTKGLNQNLRVLGLLPTFYDGRTILGRDMLQELRDMGDHHIFENMIKQSVRLGEAPLVGRPVTSYAGNTESARAYRGLAREVIELG